MPGFGSPFTPIDPRSLRTPPFAKPQAPKGLTLEGKVTISHPDAGGDVAPKPTPLPQNAAKKLAPMANLQAPARPPVAQPGPQAGPQGPLPLTAAQRLAGGAIPGQPGLSAYDNELATLDKRRQALLAQPNPIAPQREKMKYGALPIGLALLGLLGKAPGLTRAVMAYEGGKAQGNEKHYEDALAQYNTEVTKRDAQVKELDSAVNNATMRREKAISDADLAAHRRAQEAVARENAHTKALNTQYMHQHYQDWAKDAAARIGVQKAGITERYAAISAATQRALTVQGMRDDTAMFLGQLRGSIEVADTLLHDQTAQRDTDVRENGAMSRAQMSDALKVQMGAMTNIRQLINVASNPKNPGQKQAMASLQAQIADANSPLNSLVRTMQDTGVMGSSVANSIEADAEAEAGVQTGAVAPMIPGVTAPPVQIVLPPSSPPMAAGEALNQGASTVQDIVNRFRHGGQPHSAASTSTPPPPNHPAAVIEAPPPEVVQRVGGLFSQFLSKHPGSPTNQNLQAMWDQFAKTIPGNPTPQQREMLKEAILGGSTGEPQSKNGPTIP